MTQLTNTMPPPPVNGYVVLQDTARKTQHSDETVYQIVALTERCNGKIKAGTIGGWITCTENLSGDAWVADDAVIASPRVRVSGSALVCGSSVVNGWAEVSGNALVSDSFLNYGAKVIENATVLSRSRLSSCMVRDFAFLETCTIPSQALVHEQATLSRTVVHDGTSIGGEVTMRNCSVRRKNQPIRGKDNYMSVDITPSGIKSVPSRIG